MRQFSRDRRVRQMQIGTVVLLGLLTTIVVQAGTGRRTYGPPGVTADRLSEHMCMTPSGGPAMVKISGIVRDSTTGLPVAGALVTWQAAKDSKAPAKW